MVPNTDRACFNVAGCNRPHIRQIYAKEKEKSEKFTKKFFKWLFTSIVTMVVLKIFESYFRYYRLHQQAASFKPLVPAT